MLDRNIFKVKCKTTTNEEMADATPIPKVPYANKQIGIPILPVFGKKKGGSSLDISYFIKNKKMTPVKANEVNNISE